MQKYTREELDQKHRDSDVYEMKFRQEDCLVYYKDLGRHDVQQNSRDVKGSIDMNIELVAFYRHDWDEDMYYEDEMPAKADDEVSEFLCELYGFSC